MEQSAGSALQTPRRPEQGVIFMFRQKVYLTLNEEPVFSEDHLLEVTLRLSRSKFEKCAQDRPHMTRVDEVLRSGGVEATDIASPIKKNDKTFLWVAVSETIAARELTGKAVEEWKKRVREDAQQILNSTFGRNHVGRIEIKCADSQALSGEQKQQD